MFNNWVIFEKYSHLQINLDIKNKLQKYYIFLTEQNKVHNLTRIIDENSVFEKHFLDSVLFTSELELTDQKVLDIGSGAGFPGVVLKIFFPDLDIVLVESNGKKFNFLKQLVSHLNLEKITVINERVELYSKNHIEEYYLVISRAVANLKVLLEIGSQLVKINGLFVALKGPSFQDELDFVKNFNEILGFKLITIQRLKLLNIGERVNLFYKKNKETPKIYPRKYSLIKK